MKTLEDAVVKNKTVLLRLDLNVPIHNGVITDKYRLKTAIPTIYYLVEQGAKIVIVSHLGRPKGVVDQALSLKPIYQELSEMLKIDILFTENIFSSETKKKISELKEGEIIGLENIRFEDGEEDNSRIVAKKLASLAELYVNDGFSVSHREASSVVAITEFLPSYPGLLLEKEVQVLRYLLSKPEKPYLTIVGGAKIADKIELVSHFVAQSDKVLIGGGIANTFLMASGVEIKNSLVEKDKLDVAREILKRSKGKIVLPEDFIWSEDAILDIGPKTISLFSQYLSRAKTVFWNGCLGYTEDERFRAGSDKIAEYLTTLPATTVVGGGNTVEVLNRLNIINKYSFVSSGGGATLEYLAGRKLPGLIALESSL